MNRTDRLYALVEELRAAAPRARPARWLADRFEVSVRTIERDIGALQESGVPIWATPGPGGGYTVDPSMTLPPLNFSAGEATAIAIALRSAGGSMPFGEDGRRALQKVTAAMTAASLDESRDLLARIHLLQREGDLERSAIVRAVERGVAERRVVELDYTDRDGNATAGRRVEPYGLAGSEYGWYLLGWCRLRDGQRVFRLDRIAAIRVTDETAPDRGWTGPLPEPWRRPEEA